MAHCHGNLNLARAPCSGSNRSKAHTACTFGNGSLQRNQHPSSQGRTAIHLGTAPCSGPARSPHCHAHLAAGATTQAAKRTRAIQTGLQQHQHTGTHSNQRILLKNLSISCHFWESSIPDVLSVLSSTTQEDLFEVDHLQSTMCMHIATARCSGNSTKAPRRTQPHTSRRSNLERQLCIGIS